jgi:hypothetical protein
VNDLLLATRLVALLIADVWLVWVLHDRWRVLSAVGLLVSGVAVAISPIAILDVALRLGGKDVPLAIVAMGWIDGGLILLWFILEFAARRVLVHRREREQS